MMPKPHNSIISTPVLSSIQAYAIPLGTAAVYAPETTLVHTKEGSFCRADVQYDDWTKPYIAAAIGAFSFSCLIQVKRLLVGHHSLSRNSYKILASTLVINILGLMSVCLQMIDSNICKDSYGVVTFAANWCSWLVTVPLLVYTALVPDYGTIPSQEDSVAIISTFFMILIGMGMLFEGLSQVTTAVLFVVSSLFFLIALYFMYVSNVNTQRANELGDEKKTYLQMNRSDMALKAKLKKDLSVILALVMIIFPVIYMLAIAGLLDPNVTLVCYLVLDVVSKGFVAFTAMDSHLSVLSAVRSELDTEKDANTRRRAFMKYMFHEVRIPLNAMAMSLDVFVISDKERSKSVSRDPGLQDIINTMDNATVYLEQALNSYLAMQQIEEGCLVLASDPFDLKDVWNGVRSRVNARFARKNLKVEFQVNASVPHRVVGDSKQLVYALTSLLTHAAQRSSTDDEIIASVSSKLHVPHEFSSFSTQKRGSKLNHDLTISFTDSGGSMCMEDIESMFIPFATLFTGDMLGEDGSGLSLVIAKEIIVLCSGRVQVKQSPTGKGLTYVINLKLPCVGKLKAQAEDITKSTHLFSGVNSESRRFERDAKIVPDTEPTEDVKDKATLQVIADSAAGDCQDACTNDARHDKKVQALSNGSSEMRVLEFAGSLDDAPMSNSARRPVDVLPQNIVHTTNSNNSALPSPQHAGKRNLNGVLCVDDTPSNLKMLRRLLKIKGVASDGAVNGLEATVTVAARTDPEYTLIFMDYTMPIMNGIEATRIIRESGFKGCIVAVTGNAMDDDVKEFLDVGADAVVAKPMKAQKLEAILNCFELGDEDVMKSREKVRLLQC